MQRILEPGEVVSKVWGKGKPKPAAYRPLHYLLRTPCEDGDLLYNVVTGEMVLLTEEEKALLDSLPAAYSPAMDDLIAARFLVPEDFDEKKSVDQLRKLVRATHPQKISPAIPSCPPPAVMPVASIATRAICPTRP